MKHLVRTFVGLRCGPSIRRRMHAKVAAFKADDGALRLPAVEDLHTTVQFLGNTPQGDLAAIGEALAEAVGALPPIEVAYRGLGAFPSAQRPRVIWAGVEEPDGEDRLGTLVKAVGHALRPLGYRPEKRAFHAHVTVARVRRRPSDRILSALSEAQAMDFGGEMLSELKLMLSDPSHRPYHYIDLTTVPFEG